MTHTLTITGSPVTAPPAPIVTTVTTVATLQSQLAAISAAKTQALATISQVIAAGPGPTYSTSGDAGSESIDWTGYLGMLNLQVKTMTETELTLIQALQDLQPFDVRQRVGVGGRRGRFC
jgi:hypothetical protein